MMTKNSKKELVFAIARGLWTIIIALSLILVIGAIIQKLWSVI